MKKIVMTKDATIAKRAGIATSVLGWIGSVACAASTILTNDPIYLYSMGAISTFIAVAGIGLTIYANKKHGAEKKILEFCEPNVPRIRIPEKKLQCITNHPDFWDAVRKLEHLDYDNEIFYMTIDKTDPNKIKVTSWVNHSNKAMYTLKDSSEINSAEMQV